MYRVLLSAFILGDFDLAEFKKADSISSFTPVQGQVFDDHLSCHFFCRDSCEL